MKGFGKPAIKPVQKWPGVTLNPREMLKAKGIKVDDDA